MLTLWNIDVAMLLYEWQLQLYENVVFIGCDGSSRCGTSLHRVPPIDQVLGSGTSSGEYQIEVWQLSFARSIVNHSLLTRASQVLRSKRDM